MRIGLAYNQRPNPTGKFSHTRRRQPAAPTATDAYVEWDDPETIAAVEDALRVFGDVIRLEAVGNFASRLRAARVDLLFNMAEGLAGPSREAHVAAIAEFLGVPYTASDPLTLALALHKGRTKEILAFRGIPTAPFALIESPADFAALKRLAYPVFLKPVWEGSSKGVAIANHVTTPASARRRARELLEAYTQPVLAESFLTGDEFTVAVIGNGAEATCLPLIRYRCGDFVRPAAAGQRCACGRSFPLIEQVIGRRDDSIKLSDGRSIGRLDHLFKGVEGILEAQIRQDRLDALTMLVVPSATFNDCTREVLQSNVRHRMGDGIGLEIRLVDAIPRTGNGKFKGVVCNV